MEKSRKNDAKKELSKVKLANETYFLKDAEARETKLDKTALSPSSISFILDDDTEIEVDFAKFSADSTYNGSSEIIN